jgi:C4-dicarboxylate-specific signal transduction histidine kinase
VAWLGQTYLEAGLDPLGLAFFAAYGALFAYVLWLYGRNLARMRDHAVAVFVALCLWALLATNDMAVTLELYPGVYLLGLGYAGFWAAFSAILVRRFVRSSEDAERWADTLQRLVDERTAELRERDLQLADGQRLATLATLAASCAHELNNPAAYVTSNLNRLSELAKHAGGEAAAELEEILAECREGVERIRAVVGELLSLARRSDGEREPVDVSRVVEGALVVARTEARFRVEIVAEIQPVPKVTGDARLLGQVALQLLLNGVEAAASGRSGHPRVGVETSFEDGSVWLVVRDNGPGIPAELRPRLFDPLSARGEHGRPGLGLAVTHQIVTSLGGRIDVESDAAGTTIVVELPPAKA